MGWWVYANEKHRIHGSPHGSSRQNRNGGSGMYGCKWVAACMTASGQRDVAYRAVVQLLTFATQAKLPADDTISVDRLRWKRSKNDKK